MEVLLRKFYGAFGQPEITFISMSRPKKMLVCPTSENLSALKFSHPISHRYSTFCDKGIPLTGDHHDMANLRSHH